MNLEQVSHYIAHPHELGLNEAPALKEMSEKHPYAAVFSLLYLTALANGKSVDLDVALQQHAYRLNDRTKLYHLVNSSVTEAVEHVPAQEETRTEAPPVSEEPITSEELPVKEETVPPTPEEPISAFTEPETLPAEEGTAEAEETLPAEEPSRFDLVTEAFTREQHFDILADEPVPTEITEELTSIETAVPEEEIAPSVSEAPVETEVSSIIPLSPPSKEEASTRSFTSWLKSGSGDTSSAAQPEAQTTHSEPAAPEKKRVDDIIEHFIKEEPSITRSKAEFFSPSRKAKESLDEDAVPVSETLAKIYAAQGNYPKAIHVYHQLMLSFPEKKSLFAVQIEILKKKITA